jgi:phosphatidylglycerophosphatase C
MTLALFDFDGTITQKDTFIEFLKFTHGKIIFSLYFLMLSPVLILLKLKLIPNWRAKEIVLSFFYRSYKRDTLEKLGNEFINKIDKLVYTEAKNKINFHKESGDRVIVVSASCNIWIKPWCNKNQIELISTDLLFIDNKFSGKLNGKNCYGAEKVVRITQLLNLNEFKYIYAYGDSKGDKEMLSIANEMFYKHFKF